MSWSDWRRRWRNDKMVGYQALHSVLSAEGLGDGEKPWERDNKARAPQSGLFFFLLPVDHTQPTNHCKQLSLQTLAIPTVVQKQMTWAVFWSLCFSGLNIVKISQLGVVAHTHYPGTCEVEAGGLQWVRHWLHSESMSCRVSKTKQKAPQFRRSSLNRWVTGSCSTPSLFL